MRAKFIATKPIPFIVALWTLSLPATLLAQDNLTPPAPPSPASSSEKPTTRAGADTELDASIQQTLDTLPRRLTDKAGTPGDMVNLVIIGSERDVKSALAAAKWSLADTSNTKAVAKAVIQTYQKKDYFGMPMSQLYLFGRVQEFGYEEGEPHSLIAMRHHFRLWKAPFDFDRRQVWVGAGTHDIGLEKDQRTGHTTHKIDPAVDLERTHIVSSLQRAGKAASVSYYLPSNPVKDANSATGGHYYSDGRIAVISLEADDDTPCQKVGSLVTCSK